MRAWLVLPLLLALSGCVGYVVDSQDPEKSLDALLPDLESYRDCRFAWPDGTSAPCHDDVPVLEAADAVPELWVCHRALKMNDAYVQVYHDVLGGGEGIWLDAPGYEAVYVHLLSERGVPTVRWVLEDGRGFMPVPDGEALEMPFRVMAFSVETDREELEAPLSMDVAVRGDHVEPVFHVGGHHFSPLGVMQGFASIMLGDVGLESWLFGGPDFELTISADVMEGPFQVGPVPGMC